MNVVSDRLTERDSVSLYQLEPGKEKARETQKTNPWRATQRSAEERRGARSSSTVEAAAKTRNGSKQKESCQDTCGATLL